jgi:hypothetical protein
LVVATVIPVEELVVGSFLPPGFCAFKEPPGFPPPPY